MPQYNIYLEIDDDSFCAAHISELMGFYVCSKSLQNTIDQIPDKVQAYRRWLRQHGEKLAPGRIDYDFKEIIMGVCPRLSGNKAALFSFDLDPPTTAEIRAWLKRAQWNRQDLRALIQKIPPSLLDRKIKGKRSIREILHHIADCDWWYVSRLNIKLPENGPDEVLARLDWARRLAVNALRHLSSEQKHKIFVPTKHCGSTRGEKWTARKVFRRILEHEREHIENIEQTLARLSRVTSEHSQRG